MISRLHENAGIDYEPEQDAPHAPARTFPHRLTLMRSQATHTHRLTHSLGTFTQTHNQNQPVTE